LEPFGPTVLKKFYHEKAIEMRSSDLGV
jgi:hypothetical protein